MAGLLGMAGDRDLNLQNETVEYVPTYAVTREKLSERPDERLPFVFASSRKWM